MADIYYASFTEVKRNNFHRVKIFGSLEAAETLIKVAREKCKYCDTIDKWTIIPYSQMQEEIGDTQARQDSYYEEKEKADEKKRKERYELDKEKNKEVNLKNKEINPGIYKVTFWYANSELGCETFRVEADSIDDAFNKAKAIKQDPNRATAGMWGYDQRMIFNKKYITKIQ